MAVDMFLKLSNDIKGESRDTSHENEIDVLSWSWGLTQSGTTHQAHGGGGGKVNVQDMTMVKYVDIATNDLIKKCANGTHIEEGMLYVRKAGGESTVEYLKIQMKNIMITSYQTGGAAMADDRVQETITLNFNMFEITYTLQEASGAPGAESVAGWDIGKNEAYTSGA